MVRSWAAVVVVATLQLLLLTVRFASAQTDACLANAPTVLDDSCYGYLSGAFAVPDSTCCTEVDFVTSQYGAGCLCECMLAYEETYPTDSVTPRRIFNLASDCSSNADMSRCYSTTTTTPAPPSPPASQNTPSNPSTPSYEEPSRSKPARRYRVSGRAAAGIGVGILAAFGIAVSVLVKICCCTSSSTSATATADSDSKPIAVGTPSV